MSIATERVLLLPADIAGGSLEFGTSDAPGRGEGGPAPKTIVVSFGFWIFLLSDIVMFSAFFAAYAVLSGATAGGPGPHGLFQLDEVALETGCLLMSSFTCGLASLAASAGYKLKFYGAMAATFVLGATFIALEARAKQRGHRHRAIEHRVTMGARADAGHPTGEARQQEERGLECNDVEMKQIPAARAPSRLVHQHGVGGEERREHHDAAEQEDPEPIADDDALG